jgi:hypothetical protein
MDQKQFELISMPIINNLQLHDMKNEKGKKRAYVLQSLFLFKKTAKEKDAFRPSKPSKVSHITYQCIINN